MRTRTAITIATFRFARIMTADSKAAASGARSGRSYRPRPRSASGTAAGSGSATPSGCPTPWRWDHDPGPGRCKWYFPHPECPGTETEGLAADAERVQLLDVAVDILGVGGGW